MIKHGVISICLLFFLAINAQNKNHIDSLYQVKNYLLDLRSTVIKNDWNTNEQLIKVSQLMEKGKDYEKQFPIWLNAVLHEDSRHYTEMQRQFTLILQTLALYKSDLKAKPNQLPNNLDDLKFLNNSIPKLVHEIYYYCKLAEEERLKNTH
jgi:DNA repair ATPase RecN